MFTDDFGLCFIVNKDNRIETFGIVINRQLIKVIIIFDISTTPIVAVLNQKIISNKYLNTLLGL